MVATSKRRIVYTVAMARKVGRPIEYNAKIHPKAAEALAAMGMGMAKIAEGLAVAQQTVRNWKDKYPEFLEALERGKAAADDHVEVSLYERANGYSHPAVKIMTIGGKVKQVPYTERYPPDTPALVFWLKNRRPKDWRDRQEIEHSGGLDPVQDMKPEARQALIATLVAKRHANGS